MAVKLSIHAEYQFKEDFENTYLSIEASEVFTLIEINPHSLWFKRSNGLPFMLLKYSEIELLKMKPLSDSDLIKLLEASV